MVLSNPGLPAISSRDNPLVKRLRRLAEQPGAYRRLGQYWIEGEHLCRAAMACGVVPATVVVAQAALASAPLPLTEARTGCCVLEDRLYAQISGLESGPGFGFLVDLPAAVVPRSGQASLVLDRIQDAGNVGSILRSAAAFGFRQVLAIRGTAGLWSPKVLRAAMGAHFSLSLTEALTCEDVLALGLPLVVTSSHHGESLRTAAIPPACAWVFGHEGQGVASELQQHATMSVRIDQPGGEESLNVAAAAAICLHASSLVWHGKPADS